MNEYTQQHGAVHDKQKEQIRKLETLLTELASQRDAERAVLREKLRTKEMEMQNQVAQRDARYDV